MAISRVMRESVRCRPRARRKSYHPHLELMEDRRLLAVFSGIPEWQPLGPAPIIATFGSEVAQEAGNQKVDLSFWSASGATGPIAIHPSTNSTVYVGSVNGGVWKTDTAFYSRSDGVDNDFDGVADTLDPDEVPNWTPLTDDFATPISALAFDPIDSTNQTLWAGNGKFSSLDRQGVATGGLLRTTDGGATWTELGRATFQGMHVENVVPTDVITPTGQLIMVAARGAGRSGVYRSADGGQTWTRLLGRDVTSLIQDPTVKERFFAGVPRQGIYYSDGCAGNPANCGTSWSEFNTGIGNFAVERIQLAGTNAGTGSVFAAMVIQSAALSGVTSVSQTVMSKGVWNDWDEIDLPANQSTITGANASIRHMAITADPTDQHRVLVSGIREIAVGDGKSDTWFKLTTVNPKDPPSSYTVHVTSGWMHDDVRDLKFTKNGDLLVSTDGGLYRLVGPFDETKRHPVSLNGNLAITETNSRFSLGYDPIRNQALLGTQDNGTLVQIPNKQIFSELTLGDGNTTAMGLEALATYHYVASNNWQSMKRVEHGFLGGSTETTIAWAKSGDKDKPGLVRGNDAKMSSNTYIGGFVLMLNEITPSSLLLGTRAGLYESHDRGNTISDITPGGVNRSISAAAYGGRLGSTKHADVIYVGASDRLWIRTPGSTGFGNAIASYTGTQPRDIVLNPNDWAEAYVLDRSSDIWLTTNAGGTWSNLTNGTQLGSLESLDFAMINGTPVLLAAGEEGLYRRINPKTGVNSDRWSLFGTGLPRVVVKDVVYDPLDDLLLVGTLGRGIWTIDQAGSKLRTESRLVINGDLTDDGGFAFPMRDDVIRIAKSPQHEERIDIFVNHVSGPPQYTVAHAAVDAIQANTKTGNDFIQVDYLPPGTDLAVNGGPGRDVFYTSTSEVRSNINFYGDADPDQFSVTPTTHADLYVHGGSPNTPADGDTLRVTPGTAHATVNPGQVVGEGTVDVNGHRSIRYYTIENASAGAPTWHEDQFEANNSFASAENLAHGDQIHLNLTIHDSLDHDWYKWQASHTGLLTIELLFDDSLGDLNLTLYDSSQSKLNESKSTTDNELLTESVSKDQWYYILVDSLGSDTHPDYNLELDWPFDIKPDRLESNDTFGSATSLGNKDQTLTDLTIHEVGEFASDEDWFQWTAKAPGLMSIETHFRHSHGNLELELYSESQTLIAAATSTNDNEIVSRLASAGDTFFIRVFGWFGAKHPDYDLKIVGSKILPDIFDATKKNGTAKTATDLATGSQTLTSLSIGSEHDHDWFQWKATGGVGQAMASVRFAHALGDVDMRLYDAESNLLDSSQLVVDQEQISWTAADNATYFIEVYGVGGDNYDYSLEIEWAHDLPKDGFEPNESIAQAFDLQGGDLRMEELTIQELGEFQSSDDYYRWEAWNEGLLEVTIDFLHAAGNLELELYDAAGSLLQSSTSMSNSERVLQNVALGELYFIRVYGLFGATSADYDLTIDGANIYQDVFEPNNSIDDAYHLGMGDQVYEGISFHAIGNEDWYTWLAPVDGALAVEVHHDPDVGDLDLEIRSRDGTVLGTSNTADGTEHVEIVVGATESYIIRVHGGPDTTNPFYTLALNGPDVEADRFEPNDGFHVATDLGQTSQLLSGLTIHEPRNSDWYRWTAPASGTLNVHAFFEHARGDVDIQLHDGAKQLLADSRSTTDGEHVATPVVAGNSYFLTVFGPSLDDIPKMLRGSSITIMSGAISEYYELEFAFETDGLTGQIIPVEPDPRSTAVQSVEIAFAGPVDNLPVEDLVLTRSADTAATIPLVGASLITADQFVWQLNDLQTRTEASGIYKLTLPQGSLGGRLLNTLAETWINRAGDANEDNVFNSTDLVQVFVRGEYEDAIAGNSTWSDGDWNGDGDFNTTDLVVAFQGGAYVTTANPVESDVFAAIDLLFANDEDTRRGRSRH